MPSPERIAEVLGDPTHRLHGSRYCYLAYKCRCELCRGACAEQRRAQRATKIEPAGLTVEQAMAVALRVAERLDRAELREWSSTRLSKAPKREPSPPVSLPPAVKHGTLTAYHTYKCRCEPCRGARRKYRQEKEIPRAKMKEAT